MNHQSQSFPQAHIKGVINIEQPIPKLKSNQSPKRSITAKGKVTITNTAVTRTEIARSKNLIMSGPHQVFGGEQIISTIMPLGNFHIAPVAASTPRPIKPPKSIFPRFMAS